jgi:hypothetical protein
MYTLRVIEERRKDENSPFGSVTTDFDIGGSYSILKNGVTTEFDEAIDSDYPNEDKSKIRALLVTQRQQTFFIENDLPLRKMSYFIVTESGSTLTKL